MTVDDVMLQVTQALDDAKVQYMLVGAFSSNYHGIPRSTQDVDIVIELNQPLTGDFSKLLGEKFLAEPQLSSETNTGHSNDRNFESKVLCSKLNCFDSPLTLMTKNDFSEDSQ